MDKNNDIFHSKKVVTVSVGHFFHDIFSSFLAVCLPLLISKFSLTLALAGFLTVVFRIPNLLNPLLGMLSDRVNLFRLAIWAPAITAAAMGCLGIAPSYFAVCGLLLVAGLSAAVFHVAGPVMIAESAGAYQGRGMSFWMTGGEFARTLGPIFAVWVISLWGFEGTYFLFAIGFVASCLLHQQLGMKQTVAVTAAPRNSIPEVLRGMRKVLVPLMGIMTACSFMASSLMAFLPTYMVDSGQSLWMGGLALAVLEGFGTLGTFFGGTLSDRIGRRRMLLWIVPISALLMMGFVYSPDVMAVPIIGLLGLTLFASAPIELAIVQDYNPVHRGTANGLFMGFSFILMAGVSFFVGWLSDHIGMQKAFAISSIFGLLGTPFVFFLPKRGGEEREKKIQ